MMKQESYIKMIRSRHKGAALILALIMLAVTMLIIPALVLFMNSGAKTGIMYSDRNDGLYAADAGIHDAIRRLNNDLSLADYNLPEQVNDKNVDIAVMPNPSGDIGSAPTYLITSRSKNADDSQNTVVKALVSFADFGMTFGKNAITVFDGSVTSTSVSSPATAEPSMGVKIDVTNGGSGYTTSPAINISGGGGTGAHATAVVAPAGSLSSLTVGEHGSGYSTLPTVTIDLPLGGGTRATAIASLTPSRVHDVQVTAHGSGYTSVPAVIISGGNGTGAGALANLQPTSVGSITIVNDGSRYSSTPSVTVSSPPTGGIQATATATLQGNHIGSITLNNHGTGYTAAPTVTIGPPSAGGTQATATASLTPTQIQSVSITDGGSGYTATPGVAFSGGNGSGASATATIAPTSIANLVLTNLGSGYTSVPNVIISPPSSGVQATASATVGNGTISSVVVSPLGTGYTSVPTVTIGAPSPGGIQAAISPSLCVSQVNVTDTGSGYDYSPVVLFSNGGGSGAAANAIMGPNRVESIQVVNNGSGYTSIPFVTLSGGLHVPESSPVVFGNIQLHGGVSAEGFSMAEVDGNYPVGSTSLTLTHDPEFQYTLGGKVSIEGTINSETIDYNSKHDIDDATCTLHLSNPTHFNFVDGDTAYVTTVQDVTPIDFWPNTTMIRNFYFSKVSGTTPWTNNTIDVSMADQQGPLLVDNRDVNANYQITGDGTLNGTIFVNGNLNFDNGSIINLHTHHVTHLRSDASSSATVIDVDSTVGFATTGILAVGTGTDIEYLNYVIEDEHTFAVDSTANFHSTSDEVVVDIGQAIFVTGHVTMDTHVNIIGPGAIIVIGDLEFQPNLDTGSAESQNIMVLSLEGSVDFQPENGTIFYGSVGGRNGVNFNTNIDIRSFGLRGLFLDIPMSDHGNALIDIKSWIID
jgi:hypothetical protein